MAVVDLRSDTVTKPSAAMRQAMAEAEVGDDVYGEDPTINRLEEQVAQLLEKPSALFMPSGTMANQVAMLSHTERGDEVFIHREAHAYFYEGGAPALWAGVTLTLLEGTEGLFDSDTLAAALRPENIHHPRPRLVWLENTHNRAGGAAFGPELMGPVMDIAHRRGLVVHVDGARLFNAAVALNVPAARLVHDADSVSVCLSKGLGAPVGSLLVGPTDFIDRARRYRKWLGGGMRQAGVLAAAGLVALTQIDRLAEDHERARRLAEGLRDLGYRAWQPSVPTNMVMVDVDEDAGVLAERCRALGVLVSPMGAHRIRLVTHLDIDDCAISRALDVFHEMRE
ncbi:L-allo-threonine aldolase [Sulfobacillus acidophilus TPY]|uniref:L-threonine aldolase n=1 Tax=Sulfobacillus acidophilus (strain ATCC 700253 / DSM 10332 / NAL) TaxID=679936 RepID=G8TY82_SULAD|nr:L-allo-threonine aldolase [Sulfobacillus acidophilus TPY]AEW05046.1 L-threonine aldolase [Sulfobacillus acidophilus DSM 10332]